MAVIYKKPRPIKTNPLKYDPSKTGPLRRQFIRAMQTRFRTLRRELNDLVLKEDAFGLAVNARWQFSTSSQMLAQFQAWLLSKAAELFYPQEEDSWWNEYVTKGWQQGAHRVFQQWTNKTDFLKSAFDQPVSVEKVKLLASRVLTELQNVTQDMATKMSRSLVDGLIRGESPRTVAKQMAAMVDVSEARALTIARTETVRAHAEGQLDVLEKLGMQEVGVAVEWSTSGMGMTRKGNPSPCKVCAPMQGVVFSLEEARGMIPRHPNCMCSFVPANVGEDDKKQVRSYRGITDALQRSLKASLPKKSKRTLAQQAKRSVWGGGRAKIAKKRPTGII